MKRKAHAIHECICQGGKIEIPRWQDDVEDWGFTFILCPICKGKHWLDPDEWDQREKELKEKKKGAV